MANMNCPTCGGRCNFVYGKGYVCECCGNIYDTDVTQDGIADKLNLANLKRCEEYDFEDALKLCREILIENPNNQDANWCALLAEYKVIYLQNDDGKYEPTFLNPDVKIPLTECKYYRRLNTRYRAMADEIENVRKMVVRESKDIPDYDVFISYRQHQGRNSFTEEAAWAEEFYRLLSKQTGDSKLRVFYDRASLDRSNAGWEPHIYAALSSAKFMVLMGSSLDNINSTWVKNEWKRFIAFRNMGKEKSIAVLGKNIDPAKLPDRALRSGQMIRADEKGWQVKLLKRANDACKENKDVLYLLNEAEVFIRKRKFKKAERDYKKVCTIEPRNSKAYWGLLKCKLKAMDDYDIVKCKKKIVKINEYNEAVRYAEGQERDRYLEVSKDQLDHKISAYERENYNIWKKNTKAKRAFKKIAIVAACLLLCAFGTYTYFGITQPVWYKVEKGKATLRGTSLYFNYLVTDLEIDTYQDYPVVKIADGALKNSNLKTFTASNSLKEIGNSAFENCNNLTSVTIENCIYIGSKAFNNCTKLTELKIGITDSTVIEADAFTEIGENSTVHIPTVAEKKLSQLKIDYPSINFVTYTRDKVEECEYFIAKTRLVSADSETDIQKAENLYNELSPEEKASVKNYGVLQDAKVSFNVAVAIDAIGEITLNSEAAIIEAENLYGSLTAEQKKAVSNYGALTTARAVYNTMSLINSIGEVAIDSEPKIATAEEAYLSLSYEQKELVSNYGFLTTARTKIDIILANAVVDKISGIGSVISLDSKFEIAAAESAYDSLTDGQKDRVFNYSALTDARTKLDNLFAENAINKINDIPAYITVNEEDLIIEAETFYNNLSSKQKSMVTNFSKLSDALEKLAAEIKKATTLTVSRLDSKDRWTVHDGYGNGRYNLNGAGYIANGYQIKIDISALDINYIKKHHKNIKLSMNLVVWEYDDGYQEIYIYNSGVSASDAQNEKVAPVAGIEFEHGPGRLVKDSYKYLFTAVISANAITSSELWIVFDSFGEGDDDWGCNGLVFGVEATDEQETKMSASRV